jgi:hypothetical protein
MVSKWWTSWEGESYRLFVVVIVVVVVVADQCRRKNKSDEGAKKKQKKGLAGKSNSYSFLKLRQRPTFEGSLLGQESAFKWSYFFIDVPTFKHANQKEDPLQSVLLQKPSSKKYNTQIMNVFSFIS